MTDTSSDDDFTVEETKSHLDEGKIGKYKLSNTYDYLQRKQYLYVSVVKAKNLVVNDFSGSCCDPYAEVWVGRCKGTTRHIEKSSNPEWNQVFAFARDHIQANMIDITVKDKDAKKDDFMGCVLYDLCVVPKRAPPDSPVAPQWYRLENRKGKKLKGELMLAVWWGIQADEVFPEAWHTDDASVWEANALANSRSKVYLSPKLWYLRVNVIEAQDLIPHDRTRFPEVFVKAVLGHQTLCTKISSNISINPLWNEDLMFVAAEPFDEPLILSIEDKFAPNHNEVLGTCSIRLQDVDRRLDCKAINTRWFYLEKNDIDEGEKKEVKFASRIHLRICLEGGYHVVDESTDHSSDLRPTSKHLWRNSIGVLEVGILSAHGLLPMKTKEGRGTTDAFCVAKYGRKWVRTRTIVDSLTPKWNERYTWEVFDPCTYIIIGVFDLSHLQSGDRDGEAIDSRMGKVRIRVANLEIDRVYTPSYPLLVMHPSGVKKMGEIMLEVRFKCSSFLNMMHMYSQPLLPKMHYTQPLTVTEIYSLRHRAMMSVSIRLGRADPPLRKEVVEYMLDDSYTWSMRVSKANFFRIMSFLSSYVAFGKWFIEIYSWKNPVSTIIIHILFFIAVLYPTLILPSSFLYLSLLGIWNYRYRPTYPPHMNTRLSHADNVHPDELDEECDTFPTSLPGGYILKMRYDRLRSISGRLQTLAGDLATQGERIQSLLSWRDPAATTVFVVFCLIAAFVLYATPFYVVIVQIGLSVLRHPRFRSKLPSVPLNFIRRLPTRTGSML
ncbi:C2 calcium-dependent membrane targeting [Artemisia annua]|uniref:C2 calcium-dependent membrane targeting n=1 Tax=Artemisia annua TaxID=35608 RepID=A0A2U1MNC9_ARTAN|nr:C2 calcium-dependent membrane targeting [Artemisia annua]